MWREQINQVYSQIINLGPLLCKLFWAMGSMWTSPVRSFFTFLPPAPPCRSSSFVVCQSTFTWRSQTVKSASVLLFPRFSSYWCVRFPRSVPFCQPCQHLFAHSLEALVSHSFFLPLSIRTTNSINSRYACSVFNHTEVQYLRVLLPQLHQLKKQTLYITNIPKLAVLSKMKMEDNFAAFLTACFVLEGTGCQSF